MMRGARRAAADPAALDLERLWFAMLRRRDWSSLAVVPADAATSVTTIARNLAAVGEHYLGRHVGFIIPADVSSVERLLSVKPPPRALGSRPVGDLEPVTAPAADRPAPPEAVESAIARIVSRTWSSLPAHRSDLDDLAAAPAAPARVVVALEPVVSNPFGIAIALAADAVLLCVTLGETRLDSAKQTVDAIGADRFIGCAVVRPS